MHLLSTRTQGVGDDESDAYDHDDRESERVTYDVLQWNHRQQHQGETDQAPRDPKRPMTPISTDRGERCDTNGEQDQTPFQGNESGAANTRNSKHTRHGGYGYAVDNTHRAAGTADTIRPTAHICCRLVHHTVSDLLNLAYWMPSWPYCNKIAITTGQR